MDVNVSHEINPIQLINDRTMKSSFADIGEVELTSAQNEGITLETLSNLNEPQAHEFNNENLKNLGGYEYIASALNIDQKLGLTAGQVVEMSERFGSNVLPTPPMKGLIQLFFEAFNDTTLIVLILAAIVSLTVGFIEDPAAGWIEGSAILVAVFIVACVTALNDYSKEKQFRSLEHSQRGREKVFVLREGQETNILADDLVVGDTVILKTGDGVPADGVMMLGDLIYADESSLTGEPVPRKKTLAKDPFLLSSTTITDSGHYTEIRMLVIAVGSQSQWGKIRDKLVSEPENTPLQDRLDDMAKLIGYIGTGFALATFGSLIAMIWLQHDGQDIHRHVIHAFIMAVTIIVVAIPEGLPLAVTIALYYNTEKMFKDQNLVRVMAACETMGNATTICSDKTGTLTENQMRVTEGWFAGVTVKGDEALHAATGIHEEAKQIIIDNFVTNNSTSIIRENRNGPLSKPVVSGSATEGALLMLAERWCNDIQGRKQEIFNPNRDLAFPFSSSKKRSSSVVHLENGQVRVYVKGASEWVLKDCTHYINEEGKVAILDQETRRQLEKHLFGMADKALRTLCVAHKEFLSSSDLPEGWDLGSDNLDSEELILDCLVGIHDPLRPDVKEAVATAQHAGVTVRMVTGDNLSTARAIARECGILTEDGIALEGPTFRKLTPEQVDKILPKLQVLARSSPEDKYLLVARLNGQALPKNQKDWEEQHPGFSWETDRDLLLPGYKEEWQKSRPSGGQVVGVTGDGTNDAPALKVANVGLSMGTGTKVAQEASDIVILDDKFSSIVKAIMWGRSVYDNIRKFLQFQLTVNVVALCVVFVGAVTGQGSPLNAPMMLWVNMIMDTMGALALGTEEPTIEILNRRPYKRDASLISRPMWRNILCQSFFQLALLFGLLFGGASLFDIYEGNFCSVWTVNTGSSVTWDSSTGDIVHNGDFMCSTLLTGSCVKDASAKKVDGKCLYETDVWDYDKLLTKCQDTCTKQDYTHFTIIFTTFVFCQVFNEFNARSIDSKLNVFEGLRKNKMFIFIIIATIFVQVILVEGAGYFLETSHLTAVQWASCLGLGFLSLPLGVLMRFIPVKEDEETFFDSSEMTVITKIHEGYNKMIPF